MDVVKGIHSLREETVRRPGPFPALWAISGSRCARLDGWHRDGGIVALWPSQGTVGSYAAGMQPWPWSETREDRAKRVAASYRRLALALAAGEVEDPAGALAALDGRWTQLGAAWVQPTEAPLDLDGWCTAGELAELLCIDPQRLRDWARRGHIRTAVFQVSGARHYCVGDVVAYQRSRRRKYAAAPS